MVSNHFCSHKLRSWLKKMKLVNAFAKDCPCTVKRFHPSSTNTNIPQSFLSIMINIWTNQNETLIRLIYSMLNVISIKAALEHSLFLTVVCILGYTIYVIMLSHCIIRRWCNNPTRITQNPTTSVLTATILSHDSSVGITAAAGTKTCPELAFVEGI